jgi:ubiquinone/menaquinone biosynthesis methyltransferase
MTHPSIDALFSSIAPSYDLMNDIMSFGVHHLWKNVFVERLPLIARPSPLVYMDVACGSGDIVGRVLAKAKETQVAIRTICADPNKALLAIAQSRYSDFPIEWLEESAETLPLADESIDLYTISFGLRNVAERKKVLKKAWDILVPGGEFWCLEFSHPENPLVQQAFYAYLKILPLLGQGVIGQSEPYAYLAESIKNFPKWPVLELEMVDAGFQKTTCQPLSYGVVSMIRGVK